MSPEILKSQEYDEVIVTVYAYETVIDYLLSQGISREKIFIYDAEEDGIVALVNVMPIIKQVKKSMLLESFLEDEYKEFNRVVIVGNDVDYGLVKDFFSVMQPDLKVVCEGEISEIHDNDKYIFAGKDYKEDIKKYRPKFKSEEQWIILPLYVVARDIRL
jgi:DNA repair photolyase